MPGMPVALPGVGGHNSQGVTMSNTERYNQTVAANYAAGAGEEENRRSDLAAFVLLGLGKPLNDRAFELLYQAQTALRNSQYELVEGLTSGKLSREGYLERLNGELRTWTIRSIDAVGKDAFVAIFGTESLTSDELVDRDTFMSQTQR